MDNISSSPDCVVWKLDTRGNFVFLTTLPVDPPEQWKVDFKIYGEKYSEFESKDNLSGILYVSHAVCKFSRWTIDTE